MDQANFVIAKRFVLSRSCTMASPSSVVQNYAGRLDRHHTLATEFYEAMLKISKDVHESQKRFIADSVYAVIEFRDRLEIALYIEEGCISYTRLP